MIISQAAIDLIIAEEVSSEAVYRKRYTRPEWPGLSSGPTVGIGYDLGQAFAASIRNDWLPHLPAEMVEVMASCAGKTGPAGQVMTTRIRDDVNVPWEAAMAVFREHDVPKWIGIVKLHLPHCDELSADSLGALVSLAYNRGPSFDSQGTRYTEMRSIKAHMNMRQFEHIPSDIRSMKRLWEGNKSTRGLVLRREHEAQLFEAGLSPK